HRRRAEIARPDVTSASRRREILVHFPRAIIQDLRRVRLVEKGCASSDILFSRVSLPPQRRERTLSPTGRGCATSRLPLRRPDLTPFTEHQTNKEALSVRRAPISARGVRAARQIVAAACAQSVKTCAQKRFQTRRTSC